MKKNYPTLLVLLGINLAGCISTKSIRLVTVENVTVKPQSLTETVLKGIGYFSNPNGFGISISNIDATILLNGTSVATFKSDSLLRLPKAAERFPIPLAIKVEHFKLINRLYAQITTSDSVSYAIQGKLMAGLKHPRKKVDFNQQGKISTQAAIDLLSSKMKF